MLRYAHYFYCLILKKKRANNTCRSIHALTLSSLLWASNPKAQRLAVLDSCYKNRTNTNEYKTFFLHKLRALMSCQQQRVLNPVPYDSQRNLLAAELSAKAFFYFFKAPSSGLQNLREKKLFISGNYHQAYFIQNLRLWAEALEIFNNPKCC